MFNSIADLKSSDAAEMEAEVFGYYKAGDGGGGLFYWDENSTEADNGGTIIKPTYSGFDGTGRWKRPNQDLANVKQFGIGFSQNFDEEDAFYKIINDFDDIYIPESTTVKLGTHTFKSTNVIGKKTIRGAGNTSVIEHDYIDPNDEGPENSFPLHLQGQQIQATSLSTNAVKNNDRITVDDTTGVSAGDLVFVLSNNKRESSQILEIDGNTIILADRLYRGYQAAGSKVTFYHRAQVNLSNFRMKFYSKHFNSAIRLQYVIDCDVSGIQITRDRAFAEFAGGAGILIREGYNCSVHNCKIEWMNRTSRGYGVLFTACRNCNITDNKIENCRSLDISGDEKEDDTDVRYDDTIHCLVQNNTIVSKYNQAQPNNEPNNTTRGLSTHKGAVNCKFVNNLLVGVYHYILDRGRDNIYEGNIGYGGSQLSFESPGTTISRNNNFEINEFTQVVGNLVSNGDTLTIKDTFSQDYLYLLNTQAPAYTYKQVVVEDVTININRPNGNALQLFKAVPDFKNDDNYDIDIFRLTGRVVNKNYPNREIEIYDNGIQPLVDLDINLKFDNILPDVIPETQEFYVAPKFRIDGNWNVGQEMHLTFEMEQGFAAEPIDFFTLDVSVNMFAPSSPLDQYGNAKVTAFKDTVFGGVSDNTIDFGHVVQGPRHAYGANNGVALQAIGNDNQFKVKLKRDPNDDQFKYDKYTARLVFQATTKLTFVKAEFI